MFILRIIGKTQELCEQNAGFINVETADIFIYIAVL
jgi:hypothetical protein